MTILHITAFALRGGCEKNCYHFCSASFNLQHEIIVLDQPGPMSDDWKKLGVEVDHLDILRTNLLAFRHGLKQYLRDKKYDLVILWSTIRLPLQLNALNDVAKNIRVYLGNPLGAEYPARKDSLLDMIFSSRQPVRLMACSSYVARSHERNRYFKRFQMQVSLNPVDLPVAFPKKKRLPGQFNLGMVARLDPIKDHQTILTAFKEIVKQIPTARLHLVGDGVLRQQLEDFVKSENLGSVVDFHGDVSDVYHYLNEWDVFVYATTKKEGLGSAVAEAMANGLACVLSDLPMLRELAPDPGLVLWFEAGNADHLTRQVKSLYDESALRITFEMESYKYAQKHFGIQRFVQDYIN